MSPKVNLPPCRRPFVFRSGDRSRMPFAFQAVSRIAHWAGRAYRFVFPGFAILRHMP
jgi:hypothetical protein